MLSRANACRNIGIVFQDHRLLMDRSVYDNVALPMRIDIYCVGIEAGPNFFGIFFRDGKHYFILSMTVLVSAVSLTYGLSHYFGLDFGLSAGMMAGALKRC